MQDLMKITLKDLNFKDVTYLYILFGKADTLGFYLRSVLFTLYARWSLEFVFQIDDVIIFTLGDPSHAMVWLDALDGAIADAGIQAPEKKAATAVLDEIVIGIDVVAGQHFTAHAPKLAKMLSGRRFA